MDGDDLRRRIKGARRGGRGRCCKELREAVLEFARKAKGEGQTDPKIAVALGLNVQTLRYWRRVAQSDGGQLVQVAIATGQAPETQIVVECGKLRIQGLDIELLAQLLGRLQ